MLAFLYLAYSMMALLYETVPALRKLGLSVWEISLGIVWQLRRTTSEIERCGQS
jgi:hypothetical protein